MNAPSRTPWLAHSRESPHAVVRLFCFHHAGGTASTFREWGAMLPTSVAILPVQLPGRERRYSEPLLRATADLVTPLYYALEPQLTPPFAFFGHSMGALVQFELTREIRRHSGPQPLALFASASSAPSVRDNSDPIHALPDAEFIAELRRFKGAPDEALDNVELMHAMLPILRADFEMSEGYRYVPEAPLGVPIFAYGGVSDADCGPDKLRPWAQETTGEFTHRTFRGGHFYNMTHRADLLAVLLRDLASVLPKGLTL